VSELPAEHEAPRPGELTVKKAADGERVVLFLHGEIDMASAPILERELIAAESTRVRTIVLDLAGVEFMDSSGIRALLAAKLRAEGGTHELRLRRCPSQIHRLFEVAGLLDQFLFADE
jgi:anti-sigma B factor antagonist